MSGQWDGKGCENCNDCPACGADNAGLRDEVEKAHSALDCAGVKCREIDPSLVSRIGRLADSSNLVDEAFDQRNAAYAESERLRICLKWAERCLGEWADSPAKGELTREEHGLMEALAAVRDTLGMPHEGER